jgi:D-alanyl-D-alanine carboxypeptidase-like protein
MEEREVAAHPPLELIPRGGPPLAVDGRSRRQLAPAGLPRLDEVERGLDAGPDHPPDDAGPRRPARIAALAALAALAAAGCGATGEAPRDRAARLGPPPVPAAKSVALVWGLHHAERTARRLRRDPAVSVATVLGRGVALLRAKPGYAIPLDAISVDPRRYARTVAPGARAAFAGLRRGTTVISQTEAELRRVRAGTVLRLADGRRMRVAAVVADDVLHGAEVAVAAGDPRVPPLRTTVIAALRAPLTRRDLIRRTERGAAARILPGGPLPASGPIGPARPALLKVRFGEPAVGLPYGSDWIRVDPAFVRRHIITRRVPILGSVRCHRAMVPHLRAALAELARRGLSRLVDPGDYAGCYAPRRIQPRGQLSLHAWGLAVDLNASRNAFRGRSHQDRRLVRIMERHGFTWGGRWPTRPDPMHFEFRGGPQAASA